MTTPEAELDPKAPHLLYGKPQRWAFLAILFLAAALNYADRHVVSVLIEPIKAEFHASDTQMGLLTGFAFALCYALTSIPVSWLADRKNRKLVLAASIIVWSTMTMVCGAATSIGMLMLARFAVGFGEAGGIPAAQSLLVDYFPMRQRTRALAVLMASASIGYLAAFLVATHVTATYGWRVVFIVLGAPGLVIGALILLFLPEPRRVIGFPVAGDGRGRGLRGIGTLFGKPSYVAIVAAQSLFFVTSYGVLVWFPAYMMRYLRADLAEVGNAFGVAQTIAALVGALVGGFVTDRLARRHLSWLVRIPGISLLLTLPLYGLAFLATTTVGFTIITLFAGIGIYAAQPPMYAALHRVCGAARRAQAIAVALLISNLIGLGAGPWLTGLLSDALAGANGPAAGLRYSLMIMTLFLLPAGLLLLLSARSIVADSEE